MRRHLILTGLPGAGKSAVGRIVAEKLGAPFHDVDALIEAAEGLSIPAIFDSRGELAFRRLERRMVADLLAREPAVLSPGGGWSAQPGVLEETRGRAVTVYLETRPETAAERLRGTATHPLLCDDLVAGVSRLLRERETRYLACDATVSTEERGVEQVAGEVLKLARGLAGWG